MTFATVAGGIAAIIANSLVMVVPFLIIRHTLRRYQQWWVRLSAIPAAWLSFEYLHHHWDLAWPWLTLGNGWSNAIALIQYVSLTGILGISAWMLISGLLFYEAITHKTVTKTKLWWIAGVFLILPPLLSSVDYVIEKYPQPEDRSTLRAGVVQPNFDSYQRLSGYDNAMQPLQLLLSLTDTLRSREPDIVIWPENAIESYIPSDLDNRLAQTVLDSVNKWEMPILSGGTYLRMFPQDDHPPLVRRSGGRPYLYYNSGLLFKPEHSFEVYNKNKLVPMVERIPFLDVLRHIPIPFTSWNQLPWLAKGRRANGLNLNDSLSTSTLVCYDSIFSDWIRKIVNRSGSVGFLTIITNDGWWGHTSGHLQHFAYARPRAITFDRWIVRSANNGISGIIAPDGSIRKRTHFQTRTSFTFDVPIRHSKTVFAHLGNWPGYLSVLITALYLLRHLAAALRKKFTT